MIWVTVFSMRHSRPIIIELAIGCRDNSHFRLNRSKYCFDQSRMVFWVDVFNQFNARNKFCSLSGIHRPQSSDCIEQGWKKIRTVHESLFPWDDHHMAKWRHQIAVQQPNHLCVYSDRCNCYQNALWICEMNLIKDPDPYRHLSLKKPIRSGVYGRRVNYWNNSYLFEQALEQLQAQTCILILNSEKCAVKKKLKITDVFGFVSCTSQINNCLSFLWFNQFFNKIVP